ncbi:MAG: hypothetical protein NWR43_02650 [Alphaproteobacteria bacterium]|nr:hypothetical protein [Alphaproteobacteria bacterium]
MLSFSLLQDGLQFINQQPFALQTVIILLTYALAPPCGVPISAITYTTAFIFGLKGGILPALTGYCLSMALLFEGASRLKDFSFTLFTSRDFIESNQKKRLLTYGALGTVRYEF